ncbi:MAG: 50S ribosomal protein L13 [Deltaproteobacteria bacterium]|nr:50S ribosomal protein L13 [Deltaproteobacteria bacterium]MBD91024.1 50S ribosomal protein L13 [Deltaproteobacteria bacterium]
MATVSFNQNTIEREWLLVDLEGATLGRVASRVAAVLRGKHKPTFTPNADCGDFVVVINADKVKLSGNKMQDKIYYSHSGYLGGLKEMRAEEMLEKHPERLIEKAVKGMLPRGPLGRQQFKKLYVYTGAEHPHAAQQPKTLDLSK